MIHLEIDYSKIVLNSVRVSYHYFFGSAAGFRVRTQRNKLSQRTATEATYVFRLCSASPSITDTQRDLLLNFRIQIFHTDANTGDIGSYIILIPIQCLCFEPTQFQTKRRNEFQQNIEILSSIKGKGQWMDIKNFLRNFQVELIIFSIIYSIYSNRYSKMYNFKRRFINVSKHIET